MLTAYGMKYQKVATRYLAAPVYDFEETTYPESGVAHTHPVTAYKAFDYTLKLSMSAPNQNTTNANVLINKLNRAMRTAADGLLTYQTVTLWDYHNRVKVIGTPKAVTTPTTFWRDDNGEDFAVVEFTVHVADPAQCDFELQY
jgi:hypothetical protein